MEEGTGELAQRYRIRTLYEMVDERFEEMERAHRLEIDALKLQVDLLERSFEALRREIMGD